LKRKNGECAACLKYSVLIFVEKKNIQKPHLEGSSTPVLYVGRTVLEGEIFSQQPRLKKM